MARDTTPIGTDVVIGENTPPVETTVEALIRAYNRLPLNTNLTDGQTITWDATNGVWVPSNGSSPPALDFNTGLYYPAPPGGSNSTLTLTNERLYYVPLVIGADTPFDRLAADVSSAGNAGAVLRLGAYDDADGAPGSLLFDAGTVAADTTGGKEIIIAQTVPRGLTWLAIVAQSAATTAPAVRATLGGTGLNIGVSTLTMATSGWTHSRYDTTVVSGALPATASPGDTQAKAPIVVLRAA